MLGKCISEYFFCTDFTHTHDTDKVEKPLTSLVCRKSC